MTFVTILLSLDKSQWEEEEEEEEQQQQQQNEQYQEVFAL